MIDYFKYTNGDSFTLSGAAYTGLFNITDGKAYAGKSYNTNSKLLSANTTFLADCFLDKFEFDRTVSPVDDNILKQPQISPRNVIDQNFIDTNLDILNTNNLKIYSQNIIANPDLFDFINSSESGDSYFLGLSSGKRDVRNDDTKLSKTNSYPLQIDPFSFTEKVPGINVLDDTKDSMIFIYDDESYYYFTTTETNSYTFSGSFVNGGSLIRIEEDIFEGAQRFSYDNNTDTLYALEQTNTNFILKLYDNSFVAPCRVLKLTDQVTLEDNIIDDKVSLGNNILGYRYRGDTEVTPEDNAQGRRTQGRRFQQQQSQFPIRIKLVNKYTFDIINTISSSNPREQILEFDIRDTDDSVLILTSLDGYNGDEYYLYHLDIDKISSKQGEYILPFNPKLVTRYKPEVEYNVKPGKVYIYFSGNDSNVFTLDDEGAVSTRFISNPENVAGFPSIKNLLYLEDMYFDGTIEKFNLIQKKFNSNTLPSNNYNNLNFLVAKNNTDLFYVLHNVGRIYLLKESKLLYKSFVPLDLAKLYKQIVSCESSLGISVNSELQNLIKDTVNVFLNASVIPFEEIRDGIPVLGKYVSYEGIDINFRNLEFHENEEVNYDTVSRVFNEIYKLQELIFNIIITGSSQEELLEPLVVLEEEDVASIEENLYTSGNEYILEDTGEIYVGFYHIHPEKGAMVGPLHVDTPHAYLIPYVENIESTTKRPTIFYQSNQTTQNITRSSSGSTSSSGTTGSSY